MKKKLWMTLTMLALATGARGVTNDLTGLLQQGLFEEEANRNLDAAISNYQTLANSFDKDRQVAATAIFRLGECYRKLGQTSEAAAQYQRIVRDFGDQQTLVTLSQQNLTGMGATPNNSSPVPAGESVALGNLRSQYVLLKSQLEQARKETNSDVVAELFSDNKELADGLRMQFAMVGAQEAMLRDAQTKGPAAIENAERGLKQTQAYVEAARQKIFDFQEVRLKSLESAIKDQEVREGIIPQNAQSTAESDALQQLRDALTKEQLEYNQKESKLTTLKRLGRKELRKALPTLVPDSQLDALMGELDVAQQNLLSIKPDYAADHPKTLAAQAQVDDLELKVNGRIEGIMTGLQAQLDASEAYMDSIKKQIASLQASGKTQLAQTASGQAPVTDEEEKEIRRIQELIQNSPDLMNRPNAGPNSDWTLLYQAARQGWLRVAAFLLDHGADIEAESGQGYGGTALDGAAESGNKAMVELLLSRGANVNASSEKSGATALQIASRKGYVAVAETLLAHNADVNAVNDNWKQTPLYIAAGAGNEDIVKLLLAHGANVNSTNNDGLTPLRAATFAGNIGIVKALLNAKADPNGGTAGLPLAGAIEGDRSQNRSNICELLLRAGADPNRAAPEGHIRLGFGGGGVTSSQGPVSPIYLAVDSGEADLVKLLLDNKADPNGPGLREETILIAAIGSSNSEMVEALLAHGADANARDGSDQTPVALAAEKGDRKVVESLLAHGADVNAHSGSDSKTALHIAAQTGHLELMELLISHNADVNAQDKNGKTALDWAKGQQGQPGMPVVGFAPPLPSFPDRLRALRNPLPPGAAPANWVSSSPDDVIKLLREHGAVELPNFDAIRVMRQGWTYSPIIFQRQSNDWNHYTLLETLLFAYWHSPNSAGGGPNFPDLTRIIVHRPSRTEAGKAQEIKPIILNSTNGIDCAKDLPLEFGDVVEIPMRDHSLDAPSVGLTDTQLDDIKDCLKRTVRLVVRGQSRDLNPSPRGARVYSVLSLPAAQSLLLASSDLTHVKVTRKDAVTGKTREFIVDSTFNDPRQDLWLENGDVIEVPEKAGE